MLFLSDFLDMKKNFFSRKKNWGEMRIYMLIDKAKKALESPVDLDEAEKHMISANDLYKNGNYQNSDIEKSLTNLTISYTQKIN